MKLLALFLAIHACAAQDVASRFVVGARQLIGVRVIPTPRRLPGWIHPTENRKATNSAGIIVYGLRRVGIGIPYLSAEKLEPQLEKRGWRVRGKLNTGDILHFGAETVILVEDAEPHGKLSDDDIFLYAIMPGRVRLETWKNLPYHSQRFRVYRVSESTQR